MSSLSDATKNRGSCATGKEIAHTAMKIVAAKCCRSATYISINYSELGSATLPRGATPRCQGDEFLLGTVHNEDTKQTFRRLGLFVFVYLV